MDMNQRATAPKDADHAVDPVWTNPANPHVFKLKCGTCRKPVIGDGTVMNPWRHALTDPRGLDWDS